LAQSDVIKLLKKHKELETKVIAQLLGISVQAVRRNLKQLEKQGFIVRYRGKAKYKPFSF